MSLDFLSHSSQGDGQGDENDVIVLDDDEFIQTTLNMVINSPGGASNGGMPPPQSTALADCTSPMISEHGNNSSSIIIDLTNDFDFDDLFLLDYIPPPQPPPPAPLDEQKPIVDAKAIKRELIQCENMAASESEPSFGAEIEEILIEDDDDGSEQAGSRGDASREFSELELASLLLDFNDTSRLNLKTNAGETKSDESQPGALQCRVCNKTFAKSYNLKRHMFAHEARSATPSQSSPGVFSVNQCPNCQRRIVDRSNFAKHVRLCNGKVERNEEIKMADARRPELNREHADLSSRGQFKCKLCGHVFSKKYNLFRHLRVHYLNEMSAYSSPTSASIQCDRCARRFVEAKQLSEHKKKWHETIYECKLCSESSLSSVSTFAEKLDYMKHLNREHSVKFKFHFECKQCFKSFRYFSQFMEHRATHVIKSTTNIDVHEAKVFEGGAEQLRADADAKCQLFICALCNKKFSKSFNLNRHLKTRHKQPPSNAS